MKTLGFNSYENPELSAMWPCPFHYKGITFKSIEHFYQYYKLDKTEKELRQKILNAFDPYKAKHFGSKKAGGKERKDHDVRRIPTMRIAIREAYMQNPHRLSILLSTKKAKLVHLAEWDDFWGAGKDGKGSNQFGILLEAFRTEMKGTDVWAACKAHQISEAK